MTRNEIVQVFKCIADKTIDNMPDILEPIPVVGKSIGLLVQCVRSGIGDYNKLKEETEDNLKKAVKDIPRPNFMDCVTLIPKKGHLLTDTQQEDIADMLSCDYESDDEDSLSVIDEFICKYMGGNADSGEDFDVSSGYLDLNFFAIDEHDEHSYNEDDVKNFMVALNHLLGEEVFDYFVIDGHMESWSET